MEPDSSAALPGLVFVGQPLRRRSRSSSPLAARSRRSHRGGFQIFRGGTVNNTVGEKKKKNAVSFGREAESSFEVANEGQQKILLR